MNDLKSVLEGFSQKRILVMGDLMLDKISWGDVKRVNPEQPAAPLIKIKKETHVLGGAANVANNVSALGAKCCLYGLIGKDISGDKIKKLCKLKKISLKHFFSKNPTIVKQRIMAHGQQIARMDFGESRLKKIDGELQKRILRQFEKDVKGFDFVILSDYDKLVFSEGLTRGMIDICKKNNVPTLVDPKPNNLDLFKGCSIISPNKSEAEKMSGMKYSKDKKTLEKMGRILAERVDSKYVVVTCSEDGVFAYDRENENCIFAQTKAQEVSDVAGAGDSFAAALAIGLGSGLSLQDALILANHAAGIVVGKPGVATVSLEELKKSFEK